MNPTPVAPNRPSPHGWIFFDATCRFCVAQRQRWGEVFERRGFAWMPLQTPGAAGRLGVSEAQLQQEMWLQLTDGAVFGGVDAWMVLFRRVWWLRPLGCCLGWPGFHTLGQFLYRWIARRRHCLGGVCRLPHTSSLLPSADPPAPTIHRHAAFLELP